MSIIFETGTIPTVTRATKVNPFDGQFPSDDHTLIVRVPAEQVATLTRQAREAAKAVERSARVLVTVEGKGTKADPEVSVLTVWTVPPIKRPRKAAETAPQA